jgi:hypothetical protein
MLLVPLGVKIAQFKILGTKFAPAPFQVHLCRITDMRIASQPVPCIPARIKEEAVPLPPSVGGVGSPVNYHLLGGPVGSVALYGLNKSFSFETAKDDQKKLVLSVLRLISKPIADQIGHFAPTINSGIWLCIDFNALRERIRDAGTDKAQNVIDAAGLVADLAGTAALVPKLEGAEKVADICQFFALVGDQAHHGGVGCSAADINKLMAAYQGDETQQGVLEVMDELCKL